MTSYKITVNPRVPLECWFYADWLRAFEWAPFLKGVRPPRPTPGPRAGNRNNRKVST